jgi:hypothetical protein
VYGFIVFSVFDFFQRFVAGKYRNKTVGQWSISLLGTQEQWLTSIISDNLNTKQFRSKIIDPYNFDTIRNKIIDRFNFDTIRNKKS